MIEIGIEQAADKRVVKVSGHLTVEHAVELKTAVQEALTGQAGRVVLALGPVAAADLSFFQVLCSAHRTAVSAKKIFAVERFQQDALLRLHRMIGFARRKGCALDTTATCVFAALSK